jgi:hypothetical protein
VCIAEGWVVMLRRAEQILANTERCQAPELLRGALLNQVQQIRTLSDQIPGAPYRRRILRNTWGTQRTCHGFWLVRK